MDVDDNSNDSDSDETPAAYRASSEVWMVPCVIDSKTHLFTPIEQPHTAAMQQKQEKQGWLQWEDDLLKTIVLSEGTKHWTSIAKSLNEKAHSSLSVRHGKQCRERWFNHLDPSLKKGNWTREEDLFLLEKQLELGNHWSEISKQLLGRNENSVKNRFKSLVRKAQRELPEGTDAIRWLIAEKRDQEVEMTDGNSINLISPMLSSASFDRSQRSQVVESSDRQQSIAGGLTNCAIDLVRRDLRSMERPQDLAWSRRRMEEVGDSPMSPSSFLA